jgi:hypothetical protein
MLVQNRQGHVAISGFDGLEAVAAGGGDDRCAELVVIFDDQDRL